MRIMKGLGLVVVLALFTMHAERPWQNSLMLWPHAAAIGPTVRAHMNARAAYLMEGDLDHAIDECSALRSLLLTHRTNRREATDIQHLCPVAAP